MSSPLTLSDTKRTLRLSLAAEERLAYLLSEFKREGHPVSPDKLLDVAMRLLQLDEAIGTMILDMEAEKAWREA
jgi:hypothetical protein